MVMNKLSSGRRGRNFTPDFHVLAKSLWLSGIGVCVKYFFVISLLVLTACVPDTENSTPQSEKGGVELQLSTDQVLLSDIASEFQVSATLVDGQGEPYIEQPDLIWSSSAEDIATVSSEGLVTAVGFGEAEITVQANDVTNSIVVTVDSSVTTLNGMVRYEDKEYGSAGFNYQSDYFKAVRFARVELLDQNGQALQVTHTDQSGNFSFTGVIDSQYEISVLSITDASQGLHLAVKDRSDALYSARKSVSLGSTEVMQIDIPLTVEASGAFNILDVLTNAAHFTMENTDLTQIELSAFWENNNSDGTYYCNGYDSYYCKQGKGMYIYNAVGYDTDEYDDDVLYHEFGHYFLDTLSRDDSMGGCHLLSSRDLDLRLAWSEGFGDFFPAAVKTWLASDEQRSSLLSTEIGLSNTAYIDTYRSSANISISLDSLDKINYVTAANEMAIARILYNLNQRFGMRAVVDVVANYMATVSTPTNLEAFWDGWLQIHQPGESVLATLQGIFIERKIYYQDDVFENDETLQGLTRNPISYNTRETHYLYKSVLEGIDIDIIPFAVNAGKEYRVETLNLSSGTDTHIAILDNLGNPVTIDGVEVANDDSNPNAYYSYDSTCGISRIKNNGTALASRVDFVSPITGTYYAKVRTTIDPEPYLSAGRYGSYDIMVQEY